jgi:transcriptional regulator with XRE-family HTH domain
MGAGRVFGDYLKAKKISVSEVSEKSGVNQQTIYSFINRDSNRIDINDFIKMCDAIGVRPEFFSDSFKENETEAFYLSQDEQKLIMTFREIKGDDKDFIKRLLAYYELFYGEMDKKDKE